MKILVQDLNRYVAIADEIPNDIAAKAKAGGLLHDRKVSRVITPGTLIDENFMDPFTNNYVLGIYVECPTDDASQPRIANRSTAEEIPPTLPTTTAVGLAWLDLSTGHFFTKSTDLATLPSYLTRIGPREVVLDESLQVMTEHGIFDALAEEKYVVTYTELSGINQISEWAPMLESPVSEQVASQFRPEEVGAGSILLHYLETRLQGSHMKLQPPVRQVDMMSIDKNTMRALEIKKTIRDDLFSGSLLHIIRRTVTKGGARLLDNWLCEFHS